MYKRGFFKVLAWLVLSMSLLVGSSAFAQEIGHSKKFGIGLASGFATNTLTGKLYLGNNAAIQGFVGGYRFQGLALTVDYVVEPVELAKGQAGRFFLGFGGGADFWSGNHYSSIGLHGIVELGWHLRAVPLEFVIDWRPTFFFGDSSGLGYDGANGAVRWYF